MKDSTAEQVWGWLMEHAMEPGCEQCRNALLASQDEGLADYQVWQRCCPAGRPMLVQYCRKRIRQEKAG
jgi:hypothetical protein